MTIKVLIADDHSIVRTGLSMLINAQDDMEVIATAADGKEAYQKALECSPDVVLMDISMPPGESGLSATERIKKALPDCNVLILTMHDDEEYVFRVLQGGASGYILKSAADMDVISAIRTVYNGSAYLYPSAAKLLITNFLNRVKSGEESSRFEILSEREKEVVSLIAKGFTNKEIAEQLFISVKTVESHKQRAMEKLNLKSRAELVKYALKKGLLDFE
ncbi:response regulator transcription factor [Brevibacillus sp. SYP-B805]|uniref:response regulator transcription factor n=1 Tax=Brevibacillus sp. SYP-B805 TaxID=1578199 RepID=UPI0013ED6AE2|nr:response regulator transcription factor [Brevibacillus sp. SYP-B805]NGQ93929.1 response regulator transcription factor [Brevibacillus sp. SYP-B805]